MNYPCPVCECKALSEPPYDKYGRGSDEICPCCGFHFTRDSLPKDERVTEYESWRRDWISRGCLWFSKFRNPPEDWSPVILTLELSAAEPAISTEE